MSGIFSQVEQFVRSKAKNPTDSREAGGREPSIVFDCPACGKYRHAQIRLSTGRWQCFVCHVGGEFPLLVSVLENCTLSEAKRRVSEADIAAPVGTLDTLFTLKPAEAAAPVTEVSLPPEYQPSFDHPYLKQRLVSFDDARRHLIGQCTSGKYAGRVIVPVISKGYVVAFVARDFTGTPAMGRKVLNPDIDMKRLLFNVDASYFFDEIVIVEGVFSALRVGPDAVATFGNTMSRAQMELLYGRGIRKVVLMYDFDMPMQHEWSRMRLKDGMKAVPSRNQRLLRTMSDYFSIRIAQLPYTGNYKAGPDDYPRPVLCMVKGNAVPFARQLSSLFN